MSQEEQPGVNSTTEYIEKKYFWKEINALR